MGTGMSKDKRMGLYKKLQVVLVIGLPDWLQYQNCLTKTSLIIWE